MTSPAQPVVPQLDKALGRQVGRVPATPLLERITRAGLTRRLLDERPGALHFAVADPVDGTPCAAAPSTWPTSPASPAAVSTVRATPPAEEDLERMAGAPSDAEAETTCRDCWTHSTTGRRTAGR